MHFLIETIETIFMFYNCAVWYMFFLFSHYVCNPNTSNTKISYISFLIINPNYLVPLKSQFLKQDKFQQEHYYFLSSEECEIFKRPPRNVFKQISVILDLFPEIQTSPMALMDMHIFLTTSTESPPRLWALMIPKASLWTPS